MFSLGFHAGRGSDLVSWQEEVRSQLLELICYHRTPYDAELKIVDVESSEIEDTHQVRYLVKPGSWEPQPVYVLTPVNRKLNGVTLITFHGHGDDPFGSIYTYVRELARRGYRVVMPILYGKMERETKGLNYDPRAVCASWSIDADTLGTSLLGARLFDGVLAYRLAGQLSGVDRERIACIGLSMGGELSLYLAAIEPDIRACVSAGFLSTFRSLLLERGNCQCYSIRDWPRYFDMPDIVGCIAPRPLQIQKGESDPCFDSQDVANAFDAVQQIYDVCSQPENAQYVTYPGGHCLNVDEAEAFLMAHLPHDA
jgi:dienelactone hydrolase